MKIWLDDYDSIKIFTIIAATKDGEVVAKITSDGEAWFKRIAPQNPKD